MHKYNKLTLQLISSRSFDTFYRLEVGMVKQLSQYSNLQSSETLTGFIKNNPTWFLLEAITQTVKRRFLPHSAGQGLM